MRASWVHGLCGGAVYSRDVGSGVRGEACNEEVGDGKWDLGCAVRKGWGAVLQEELKYAVCRKGCGKVDKGLWSMRYAGEK